MYRHLFNIERKAITKAIRTASSLARSSSHSTQSAPKKSSSASRSSSVSRTSTPTQSKPTSSAPRRDTFTRSTPTAKQTPTKTSTAKTSTASRSSQSKTSTTKTNTTTKTNSTVTVTKNKTTSSVSNTKRDSFEFSSETTKQLLMKPSPVNTSSHEKNTYTKDSTTIANVLKGTGTGLNNNPLSNTKYKIDLSINIDHPQGASVFKMYDMTAGRLKNGVPVGEAVFRVDMPHANCNVTHINIKENLYKSNSLYQSLNHKPISETAYKIAGNADKISKASKIGGKALCAIAIVSDANDIYNSFKSDNNSIGENTITTSAGVAGSWIGGSGGAEAGAALGATVGSFICPGLGTVIGGAIGGILGGMGGSIGGRVLGEEVAKAIIN